MYEDNRDFNDYSVETKTVFKILEYLNAIFHSKCPELRCYNVISLFAMIMDIIPNYEIRDHEEDIEDLLIQFEADRIIEEKIAADEQDPILV